MFSPSRCNNRLPYDLTAVLDPQLRVKEIKGLRVVDTSVFPNVTVDTSVFPNVTVGNTQAPTIMVAEKIADIIRGINSVKNVYKIPH